MCRFWESCISMNHPVRVLVVDDQAVVRSATRSLLEATRDFEAVGEAASGIEALTAVEELGPDLVLLDVRMPGMDGVETAARIKAAHSDTVVVLMSSDPRAPCAPTLAFVQKERLKPAVLRDLWAQFAPSG
jgi:DNA-binding NarL/FixJ family response regulator